MIKKYRKLPVEIEAIQWDGEIETLIAIQDELGIDPLRLKPDDKIVIETDEGDMLASVGDYIIRGIKGELYPCKPDVFAMTYEEAT